MRLIFLLFFALAGVAAQAQDLEDQLEAYFSFDQCKATDDSGNGSSGLFNDSVACVCGVSGGQALRFGGPNLPGSVQFNSAAQINEVFTTSDFTISFYFRPLPVAQSEGGAQLIMAKQSSCNTERAFWVRYTPTPKRKISSGISQNDTLLTTVSAEIDDSLCWQHVVLIRSGNRYSLVLNGVERDEKTTPARVDLSSGAPFQISKPVCLLDRPFKGDLDELRVYNKAINDSPDYPDFLEALSRNPDKIVNNDTLVYLGNSFQIQTTPSCAQQFEWSPTDNVASYTDPNTVISPTLSTTYYLKFFHADGCQAYDSIRVKVIDPDTLDCSQIFIPNAFTPNATKNTNDIFGISNPYAVDDFISFEVFDRWGGRVFNAVDQFETWDGTVKGQPVNPGVFLYRLRYRCEGVEKVKSGNLTVLK